MNLIFHLIWITAPMHAVCVPVATEKVFVRDLLEAAPALKNLNPDLAIGFAPLAGTQRILRGRELSRTARQRGVELGNVPDICVERAVHTISAEEMRTALLAALGIPDARLELIAFSNQPLPPGRLEFQRSTLNQPPDGAPETPVTWRGKLAYDGRRSATVWAKVRITVESQVFVAAEDIPAGTVIRDRQVKAVKAQQFPFSGPGPKSLTEIAGKVARQRVRSGQRICANLLQEAKDVVKGDIIQVRVIGGAATLSLDAIAESAGMAGDTILVHNSASGRNFRAVVEEKGKAVVRSDPGD